MDTRKIIVTFLFGLAFVILIESNAISAACDFQGCTWLATGIIAKIDGKAAYFLGKDNMVYTINTANSQFIIEANTSDSNSLRMGDTVRVYGVITKPRVIKALRIRIYGRESVKAPAGSGPQKEIKIIVEPEQPAPSQQALEPLPQTQPCNWCARGLVTDIDSTGRKLKVRTSDGQYTIDVSRALLRNGHRKIGLGLINLGDALRITGSLCALNEVEAVQVSVERTKSEAENAVPQKLINVVGIIQQIDYPSYTFKMTTEWTPIVVLADNNTCVQKGGKPNAFTELRAGMKVRMSGYGSLATGYAAKEIQIIGVSP